MLAVVRDQIGGHMIAGIPSTYIDLAMLWTPAESLGCVTPIGHGGNVFPTWSWTAWTGRKHYRLAESGGKSYGSPKQENAASEIDHFSTLRWKTTRNSWRELQ
jgi:hypothetical protein